MEFENVKDALKSAMEYAESSNLQVDGKPATAEDIQEMVRELLYNVADLLGMSEVYLGKYPMPYTLEQELLIYYLAKKNVRALHDELNDKKIKLSDRQRDLLLRELQRYQELLYTNRLNRQINI